MSEGRSIDHIVLAVPDLDAAAARYEALGFTLTPRAYHEDRMGTSNRLAQFGGRNFIEILEVDRPEALDDHAFEATPPRFSFGAHNRAFLAKRSGLSMLVFAGDDARADIEAFAAAGIRTYAPFDFERRAILPDGEEVTVAFSLAFATSPEMPEIAFFVCQNRSPQYFWKPEFQSHRNGAETIAAVYLAAEEPEAHGAFLAGLFGGTVEAVDGGIRVACGPSQGILVLTPGRIESIAPGTELDAGCGPLFVGIALETAGAMPQLTPADEACGMFIEWRRI